jgi:hypothetical protein
MRGAAAICVRFLVLYSILFLLLLPFAFGLVWSARVFAYITELKGEDPASYLLAFDTVAWRERDCWIMDG